MGGSTGNNAENIVEQILPSVIITEVLPDEIIPYEMWQSIHVIMMKYSPV